MELSGFFQWVVVGLVTIGVSGFILKKIVSYIEERFAQLRNDINKLIELKLKDPVFREMAYKAIFYAQKTFKDITGQERLIHAINFFQALIPGTFDDAIVAGVITKIYEEIMKPIKEG